MHPSIATAHRPRTFLKAGRATPTASSPNPFAAPLQPSSLIYPVNCSGIHSCPWQGGFLRGACSQEQGFHFSTHSFKHGLYLNFTHCAFRRFMTLSASGQLLTKAKATQYTQIIVWTAPTPLQHWEKMLLIWTFNRNVHQLLHEPVKKALVHIT